jgi:tRNA nucleotidyltransferase (CCA-adding enzyme)
MTFPATLDLPDDVLEIARVLDGAGHEIWCVGGAIRDSLLDPAGAEESLRVAVDFATSATPEEVQALFGRRRTVDVGRKYGTVGVFDRRRGLHEVTTFRRDVTTDGRHPVVAYGVSLDEDLARRDFTINAIAYHPLRHEWRDPFRGADDLQRRVVRAVGDPAERFREDYLRVLRALRFAARFGFTIDPPTWDAARGAAGGLAQLSAERVRDEWFKGLRTARSVAHLVRLWREAGAADAWLPELDPSPPDTGPQATEVDRAPRDPVLLVVLLCAEPAKVLQRLRASNAEIARADAAARAPAAPADDSPAGVRRWLARCGPAADDLLELWRLRRGEAAPWASVVAEIRQRGDAVTRGALAVDGHDLLVLGVPPGPRVGEVLDSLLERVLDDPSLNTRDRLIALAREFL